ncbi:MAG: DUF3054 domain-containing protein [Halolamina sp.]
MAETASYLDDRIDSGTLPLLAVDLVAIFGVVAVGMMRHNSLTGASALALTAGPFVLGWALSAVPIGAYSAGAGESAKSAVPLAIRAWVPAVVLALVVRGATTSSFGVDLAVFGVVILLVGSLSLSLLRWLFLKLLG